MNIQQLYDRDFNLWVEEVAIALRNRDINAMDWDNLIEEIEDMGASQKRALRSYTERLIEHILKLNYWDAEIERCGNSWKIEIINFRREIQNILEDSPSLNNYLAESYSKWFTKIVSNKGLAKILNFKDSPIIQLETILQDDFFNL